MTILRRYVERRQLNNPAYPLTSTALIEALGGGLRTSAGVDVSEEGALRNMAVWRAVNLISSRIASLPIRTYRTRATATSPAGVAEEVTLPLFQDEAYPDLTWFECLQTSLVHVLLGGNAYALKIRNERGTDVVRVLPIPAAGVTVTRRNEDRTEVNPSGKLFKLPGQEPLTPAEVMHIPGLSYDGIRGLSPIAHARQAIGVAIAAEDVAAKLFDSGLMNGGFLEAQRDITEEEAKAVKQGWRERVAGIVRSWEIQIVGNAFKYVPATIPPKEAQWLEARQFGVQEIARLYGIDPDHLMENSATGNTNVEQRAINLVRFGLNQWITGFEQRMSLHLCPHGTRVVLDTKGILRGDAAALASYYTAALNPQTGWMTRAEVRSEENLPPEANEDEPEEPPEEVPGPPAPPLAPVPTDEEDEDDAHAAA